MPAPRITMKTLERRIAYLNKKELYRNRWRMIMENSTYKVYLNDKLENETHMEGIAFLQYQSAHMLGKAELIQINGTKQLKYNPDTDSWDLITL